MKRGMIKMLALRIISTDEVTGYDLMKRIEQITGRRPSSGTIYPMLSSMAEEGWIERRNEGEKALYSITDTGMKKMEEFQALKREYADKIMEMMSIAHETFETGSSQNIAELLLPLFIDVKELMEKGVPSEKIAGVVSEAREKLKRMEEIKK